MTPLKIKITVRDKSLEMQVLELNWRGAWRNGDMCIKASPSFYAVFEPDMGTVWIGNMPGTQSWFDSNSSRDAYLARVKKLMSDFHVAWKAGEVEVGR